MQPLNAHSASRYALTAAIWDDHSLSIDGYLLGVDRAVVANRTFSDKAPGQPLWALPAYGLYRAFGGEPAKIPNTNRSVGLWIVTLWSATIPAAVLVSLMAIVCRQVLGRRGYVAALLTWGGTLLLPFSSALFGHVLASTLVFAAFVVLWKAKQSRWSLLAAGLLGGLAALTEYTLVLGVAVLAVWVLRRRGPKLGWFVAGGLSPLAILLAYNLVAFGSLATFSYQLNAFHGTTDSARPLLHMFTNPSTTNVLSLVFGPRGLVLATPIVLIGVWGLFRLCRDEITKDLGRMGLAMFAVFAALPIFWANPWGGDSPGPRYMIPAMAFLAPGIAMAWREMRTLTIGLGFISCLTMGLATLTNPFAAGGEDPGGISVWIGLALRGEWAPGLMAPGPAIAIAGTCLLITVFASVSQNQSQHCRP